MTIKAEYKNARESKKKIASAYLHLLTHGYDKFTVTDIVTIANVNRGTFYLHFKDINAVEKYIEDELAANFKPMEIDFRQAEIDRTPEIVLDKFNQILSEDLEFYRTIITMNNSNGLMEKIKSSIMKSISNNFRVMQYVSNIENFKIVVQYIVGGVMNAYIDWFKGHLRCNLDELSSYLSMLIKLGLHGCIRY